MAKKNNHINQRILSSINVFLPSGKTNARKIYLKDNLDEI